MLKLILIAYIVIGVIMGIVMLNLVMGHGREHDDIESVNIFMNALKNASNVDRIKLIAVILALYALAWPGALVFVLMTVFSKD